MKSPGLPEKLFSAILSGDYDVTGFNKVVTILLSMLFQ
jgi:hypothetical protein